MFQKAVDADPDFVRAWMCLAEHSAQYAIYYNKDEKWRNLADQAAARAVQLAPDQAASFAARAFAHSASDRFAESEVDLRKALELDPTYPRAFYYLGRTQTHQGKMEQATENYERSTKTDLDDYESPLMLCTIYLAAGDEENARRVSRIGVERAEKILEDYPDNQRAYYLGSTALLTLGQPDRARVWIEHALELNPDDGATRYNVACFYVNVGERKRALDLLENSVISRSWIENDPDMIPLRDDPRFIEIINSLPE